jgi:hypothetical protein
MQGFNRKFDAWRDDAAKIGTVSRNNIKRI